MINEELLSTLTILYVENEEKEINNFKITFEKLFKSIIFASDGLEAMNKFNDALSDNIIIDLIISEVSLTHLSGIDFLTHVKKVDTNIPFIFTSSTIKTQDLISAIKNGASNYLLKPITKNQIIDEIEKKCLNQKEKKTNSTYINELEEYLNSINKVAIVSIFDDNGKILYVNNFFSEVSKYLEEDLLEQDYRFTYHSDISKTILEEQWNELKKTKSWKGKIKHLSKNNSVFYTNTTITSVLNNKKNKFISINFLTTEEENKKRDYKKKVLYNLQETRRVYNVAQDKIQELKTEISKYEDVNKYEEELINQKELSIRYYKEIKELEKRISNLDSKQRQLSIGINNKIKEITTITQEKINKKTSTENKIKEIQSEIETREELIVRISNEITKRSSKVNEQENRIKV
ncbi:hypothetical protein LPB137_05885 [Poseidonibacter parvus]|uniref:Response regulatory domain-containing protein n=1 Tax=Poseidonibacter parvus TaxID=1850254 RepID=A0A1P8KLI7_9BACT|nr:response regulator [Poseidonibacter parvus]APW65410.1 hypothetical protein LPB137_05885 [Poseidonibacter parvus]